MLLNLMLPENYLLMKYLRTKFTFFLWDINKEMDMATIKLKTKGSNDF